MIRRVYPGVGRQSQCDGGQSGGTLDGEVSQSAVSEQQPLGLGIINKTNTLIFKSEFKTSHTFLDKINPTSHLRDVKTP